MKAKIKTIRTRLSTIIGVLFLVCAVAVLLPVKTLEAKDKIGFLLDWTIYGTHAPFFLALERGYYDAEGIDVTITEGQGSATVVQIVAEGRRNPIGYVDFGTMAKGVVQGIPVKAIFGISQGSPMCIISHGDNPIKTPKELEGKVIAMAPAESTAVIFPAMLAVAGVDIKKINILNPAVGAKLALFLQNRADAITGYVQVQGAQLEGRGANPYWFKYADFGANTMSNGIVASTRFVSENKDLVKRFLRAMAKGWADARKNPEAAVEAIFKTFSQYSDQKKVLVRQLELTFPLLETPNTKGKPLGWMSKKDWEQTQEILAKYSGLKKEIPVEEYFTNEYIPE
ncbi:MAG: ABC transporter substrate-binding protein [Desulfobacteria bacterium]